VELIICLLLCIVLLLLRKTREQVWIIDTSALLDGRILKICQTGCISGKVIIPKFVINTIKKMSLSRNITTQSKGHHALTVLDSLKKCKGIWLFERGKNKYKHYYVDLLKIVKKSRACLITADTTISVKFKSQKRNVIDVHDLVTVISTHVVPGEEMYVYLVKPGKNKQDAIAYLNDGTIIIVKDARSSVGYTANVRILQVIKTDTKCTVFAQAVGR
jgi:uncharacterized protein YacL